MTIMTIVTEVNSSPLLRACRKIAAAAPLDDNVRVLGPAEAPLTIVRGRFRLLVKSPRAFDLSGYLRGWLAHAPKRAARSSSKRRRSAEFFVMP